MTTGKRIMGVFIFLLIASGCNTQNAPKNNDVTQNEISEDKSEVSPVNTMQTHTPTTKKSQEEPLAQENSDIPAQSNQNSSPTIQKNIIPAENQTDNAPSQTVEKSDTPDTPSSSRTETDTETNTHSNTDDDNSGPCEIYNPITGGCEKRS